MKVTYTTSGLIDSIESEERTVRFKYNNGNLQSLYYFMKEDEYVKHREDGPAVINYTADGSLRLEQYYNNGYLTREDGPAHIQYKNGTIYAEMYYIHDEYYTKREYDIWQLNQLLNKHDLHVRFVPNENDYLIFNLINEDIIGRSSFESLEENVMGLIS